MPNANGFKYPGETDEEAAVRRAAQAKWRREQRAKWTPEERAINNAKFAAYNRARHARLPPEKKKAKSRRTAARNTQKYLAMSPEERQRYLEASHQRGKLRRERMTPEQRAEARKKFREYTVERAQRDPAFKLQERLRNRVYCVMRGFNKSQASMQLVGGSRDAVRGVLESRFRDGMSWKNYGSFWHVDHVVPCRWFDLSKPEHQRACFHHSNLQPEYAKHNITKVDNVRVDEIETVMSRCPPEHVSIFEGIKARVEAGEFRGRLRNTQPKAA